MLALWALHATLAPGWTSTIIVTAFLCGANMMMTGIMGLYVGRIYAEVKGRPLYIVDRAIGFPEEAAASDREPVALRGREARRA